MYANRTLAMAGATFLGLLFLTTPAVADPWKDESGHGRRHSREWKQEYRDGDCKIERKSKRGEYKEEIKCDRPRSYEYVRPAPIYVEPYPREPSARLTIDIPLR